MRITKTKRNKALFLEHFIEKKETSKLADKYGIRWVTAKEYIARESYSYLKKNPSLVKEELV